MAALRDDFATCPRCGTALTPVGRRWSCAGCQGLLLTEAEVSELVAEMLQGTYSTLGWNARVVEPQPLVLPARTAPGDALTCPRCTTHLTPVTLYGIDVDRCAAHGLWFDRAELESALQKARATAGTGSLGEKVFGAALVTVYVAANILALIFGG